MINLFGEEQTSPDSNWTKEFFTEDRIEETLEEAISQIEQPPAQPRLYRLLNTLSRFGYSSENLTTLLSQSRAGDKQDKFAIKYFDSEKTEILDYETARIQKDIIIDNSEEVNIGVEDKRDNPFLTIGLRGKYCNPAGPDISYEQRKRIANEIAQEEGVLPKEILDGAPISDRIEYDGEREYETTIIGQSPYYDFIDPENPSMPKEEEDKDNFYDATLNDSTRDIDRELQRERE
ncbi:hypothetical protein [Candidatus Nanohalobium constans]|uniref:Uncharacterized protein n=1 Tax=Candidatus Nanohalobium constans TaxID=2565781 RepID=A0A5Q0UGN8_9ARCH|nr:hypothetical protein [Candidatus Nanohalobium constans]QGA80788.1 hypothetical protein LC1Nh_0905 [Candidatus Nanohalobium constans]